MPLKRIAGLLFVIGSLLANSLSAQSIVAPESIVKEQGPYAGYLYRPTSPGPHPGIVLLHGSEGGYGNFWKMPGQPPMPTGEDTGAAKLAKYFASLGYVAYAVSYFHADPKGHFEFNPPKELANIELEYVLGAIGWLKNSKFVLNKPVALIGGSRGAELTLLLSSLTQESKTSSFASVVIADAAGDITGPGLSQEAADAISTGGEFPEYLPDAWKYKNKSIKPYEPIEVEKIQLPLFVTYGALDQVWGEGVTGYGLYERLIAKGIAAKHFDFHNSQDPKILLNEVTAYLQEPKNKQNPIFVRFMDEGHFPTPGSNSEVLRKGIFELALKTHLLLEK
jgi:dienelactone hydrolase